MHIEVFDNRIPLGLRCDLLDYCFNSTFKLGWTDRSSNETDIYDLNIHSRWTESNIRDCHIMPYIMGCIEESNWFTKRNVNKAIVNLVKSEDVHYIHAHKEQVALYYVNLDWKDGWYGETVFYNPMNLDEIVFTSTYKPGRILLFDSNIPHAIRPQSIKGPKFRMSLTLFFDDKKDGFS